jgi:serine O-acetyltransferase
MRNGVKVITSKDDYNRYLEADRRALGRARKRPWLFSLDPIWSFQRLLRKVEYYTNCRKAWIWKPYFSYLRFRLKQMQMRLGFCIPVNAIGPGLCINHAGPIIISNGAQVGSDLRINICVVIGENKGIANVPRIGNQVVIEPGCKIFGNIEIADGIHIGANAVVNKSFLEPGIVIAGVPARKIKENPDYHPRTEMYGDGE